ncbi:MAG: nucleotidyltransferase domain-containing protein [Phycisphaerales bacterium]|nr:nucleotidyltransferase domain-containing protein [Phycisphaerales bacterium]
MKDIRAFARRIAAEFHPRRIIVFGSYAYGTPNEDSDVDILVVMRYRGHSSDAAIEIRRRIDFGHPLDLLVRSQEEIEHRYAIEDWFIREIVDKGKILYEAADETVGREGRSRLSNGRARTAAKVGSTL